MCVNAWSGVGFWHCCSGALVVIMMCFASWRISVCVWGGEVPWGAASGHTQFVSVNDCPTMSQTGAHKGNGGFPGKQSCWAACIFMYEEHLYWASAVSEIIHYLVDCHKIWHWHCSQTMKQPAGWSFHISCITSQHPTRCCPSDFGGHGGSRFNRAFQTSPLLSNTFQFLLGMCSQNKWAT